MTAKKSKPDVGTIVAEHIDVGTIPASQPAEAEKDVVGKAEPAQRTDAKTVAQDLAEDHAGVTVSGNRLTITVPGPNGLVQTFHATVEEGIREF